ncbi:hypothetical protein [Enterocloster asparagiformis]|uniref:hypothetical protein n=1 Tax=Enterocloster asparagiformis TaxID=333367 RepID=UPI002A811FFD|nr:hypothetical protein [Enterocloster asparagiformis]
MRFLTEEDLRLLYRNTPFAEYHIEPGTRLTPGGRQFLNDRGIRVCGERASARPVAVGNAQAAGNAQVAGPLLPAAPTSPASSHELLALRRAQSIFLSTGAELLDYSVVTAGEVFELERVLASAAAGDFTREPECSACTGISAKNAGELLEDCFEVTGFHAQLEAGKEIVRLHGLRCELRCLEAELSGGRKRAVRTIINRLSQMICRALGGTVCQRKD